MRYGLRRGWVLRVALILGIAGAGIVASPPAHAQSEVPDTSVQAAAVMLTGIINVSRSPGDSRQPYMAIDDAGTLHIVWSDSFRIVYVRSFDRGRTFTRQIRLSGAGGAALRPRVAVRGSAVYVIWTQDISFHNKEIMFVRSSNRGQSFTSPRNISNTPGDSQEGRIAVSPNGTIFVVWDEASPHRNIALIRSFNGGISFERPRALFGVAMSGCPPDSPTGACTPYPGVAVDPRNGKVYVTWHDRVGAARDFQVLFSRSLDNGAHFFPVLNISNAPVHAHCASVAVGRDGRILVAYEVRKDRVDHKHDSFFAQSVNGGASCTRPINLAKGPSWAFSDYPYPAQGPDGTIIVGWEDNTAGGGLDAVIAVSTNGGASFSHSQNISNNPGSTSTEAITLFAKDGSFYVIWEDYANGNGEVFLRRGVVPRRPSEGAGEAEADSGD
jgi:hypothetical protein